MDQRNMKTFTALGALLANLGMIGSVSAQQQARTLKVEISQPSKLDEASCSNCTQSQPSDTPAPAPDVSRPTSKKGQFLSFGNLYGNTWSGVLDSQILVSADQKKYSPNGVLGTLYAQRIANYSGGAPNDASAPVTPAIGSYNQVKNTVARSNEVAILSKIDNYSFIAQGSGAFNQALSWHGGRIWGTLSEAKEKEETLTATAGQTVFIIPNGFAGVGAITKNGALLHPGTQYTAVTPRITLNAPASAGDIVKVYRSDPINATMSAELGVYGAAGTDNSNPLSGNRVGLGLFGYRADVSLKKGPILHIGTLLNIVSDPDDSTLTVDRGITFQGKFSNAIDLTAENLSVSGHLIKINSSGAGITAAGNLSIGNLGADDVVGYGTALLGNTTNGGLLRLGDGSVMGRILVNAASSMAVGTESDDDLVFNRHSKEVARFTQAVFQTSKPMRLVPTTYALLPGCSKITEGTIAYITDASEAIVAWHQKVTAGGGKNKAFLACNGAGWFAFDY